MQLQLAQVNVVASNLPALVEFLRSIGLDVPDTLPAWMGHHRRIDSTSTGLVADVDSSAFAAQWSGLPHEWKGVVLVLRVNDRAGVDASYERARAAGAVALRPPYDAFWGARIAVVEGPDGLVFAFMSPIEPEARTPPPDPTTFR
jgi:catechol 2,3-dioxygenase-like lactoylglutathione lyase family enzyme